MCACASQTSLQGMDAIPDNCAGKPYCTQRVLGREPGRLSGYPWEQRGLPGLLNWCWAGLGTLMALWTSLSFQPLPSPRAEQAPRPLTHTSLPRLPKRPRFPALTDTYLDMEVGFIMPLGHLMQSGISSKPGVTFCCLEKDGKRVEPSQGRHHPGCATTGHEPQTGALPTPHLQKGFCKQCPGAD